MKKTLVLLFAFALALPAFADIHTYGEIETFGYTQTADAGSKSIVTRTLFGVSSNLAEDIRANLTFAYSHVWASMQGAAIYDGLGDSYLDRIQVSEANVVISNIFGALEAKIGRQYYGNVNSPVMYVGPRHDSLRNLSYPTSIDGALLTYDGEKLALSAFYGQIVDMSDERLTGLTLDYAFTDNLTAGVYWYDISSSVDHLGIWGGEITYQNESTKLSVEGAKNYDGGVFSHNNEGWMVKADGAVNFDMQKAALTPRITYYHTEKTFVTAGYYSPGIIFANHYSLNDDANWDLVNAGVDLTLKALEKITFSFDYLAVNDKMWDGWLGNEFDLTAKYQHNDYVSFTLGGGILTNNSGYWIRGNYVKGDVYGAKMGMLIKF